MVAIALSSHAADRRPVLLSQEEVQQYGLTRAWYSQIPMNGRMTSIEYALLDRGTLFVVTGTCDLFALDAENGKQLWQRKVSEANLLPYAPAANSRVVGLVCGNEVSLFDRRNGRLLWHQVLPSTPTAGCQMTDYFLYVPLVDHRMACFPLEELKAPSPALLALVPQYEAIGYTLDPHTGKVTKASNQIVSTKEFVTAHQGEAKPKPSPSLLALVPDYAAIGLVLDPYTGQVTEAAGSVDLVAATVDTPLKGKQELDDLLAVELIRIAREQRRQERDARLAARQADADTKTVDVDVNAPYYLKPWKQVPLICYSFGTAIVQPIISYESAEKEAVTWFTDRGYLFIAHAKRDVDKTFALQYRIAVSPMSSFIQESKIGRFDGSIARDVAYQPAVVQKVLDDDASRFLVVVGSSSGFVFAYDPQTSETRWWQSLGSPINNRPTVIGDKVFVPCLNGDLCCLDSKNGRILWRSHGIDSFIAASVQGTDKSKESESSASQDRIYVKNTLGELVAVNVKDGAQKTLFSIKAYTDTYYNNENDRVYLITNTGLIQCLHEIGRDRPARHTYLPEAYLEYSETDEERRQLIQMPEIPGGVRQPRQKPPVAEKVEETAAIDFGEEEAVSPIVVPEEPAETTTDGGDDFNFDFDDLDF